MGKLKLYDIPYFDTFFEYVTHLSKYGDKVGICQYDRKGNLTTHTYEELAADALGLARVLRSRGLEGAHIAIAGENSYEWLSALLGITCAGAVAVPIDIEQSDDTIRTMLRRADTVSAFASDTLLPICAPLAEDGTLKKLLPLKGTEGETLRTLCGEGKNMDTPLGENLAADTDAAIFFTSGTTSAAKPVLLSHKNMLVSATESVRLALATQEAFVPLPLYHAFGLDNAVLGNMINGVRLTLCGDLKTMLRDMQLSGAATLVAVPLMVEAIYRGLMKGVEDAGMGDAVRKLMSINRFLGAFGLSFKKDRLLEIKEKAGLGNLNEFVIGGAHVGKELSDNLKLLGITLLQGYGITECSPLISSNSLTSCQMGSVGHLVPSAKIKFEDGEILIKGTNVMKGYYNDPELTAEAFDEDGWFRTGDLGYMDGSGFLYITGRKKNLIVCKNGNKVSPEMLEELIAPLPLVKEVLVSGTTGGDSTDDVKVAASICPDPAATAGMSSLEILEHLQRDIDGINKNLPNYQQIKMINIRQEEFEKTASKKIKRGSV